jgi:hypothetical protein
MTSGQRILPTPWDPWNNKDPDSLKGFTMIWYTIQLLDLLTNPSRLTVTDIEDSRQKLNSPPVPPASIARDNAAAPQQPVTGAMKRTIGVVGQSFTDPGAVIRLIEEVARLSPPALLSSSTASAGPALTATGLIEIVEHKLKELIGSFLGARNPRDVYDALLIAPSLIMQAVGAARCTPGADLAGILTELERVTQIVLAVQR